MRALSKFVIVNRSELGNYVSADSGLVGFLWGTPEVSHDSRDW